MRGDIRHLYWFSGLYGHELLSTAYLFLRKLRLQPGDLGQFRHRETLKHQVNERLLVATPANRRLQEQGLVGKRGRPAKFAHMSLEAIRQLRAPAHQKSTNLENHSCGLLLDGFDRNEAQGWPGDGLANRFGICSISLAALHVGLQIDLWDHANIVPEGADFAQAVMGAGAGFQRDQTERQLAEKVENLRSAQSAPHDGGAIPIDAVESENGFGNVEPDGGDALHREILSRTAVAIATIIQG